MQFTDGNPHLPAIYAHLTAAWERETVECGECKGQGSVPYKPSTQRGPYAAAPGTRAGCEQCSGLGRVKPKEQAA